MAEKTGLQIRRLKNNDLVLMHPDGIRPSLEDLTADAQGLLPRDSVAEATIQAYGFDLDSAGPQTRPYAFAAGLALIPISGSLYHRFSGSYGWATGYNAIQKQFRAALADEDVEGIVFDVDSYGGDCAGCFELAQEIYEARGQKPMIAVIDAHCFSAAYAVASSADRMVITRTGAAGSIGVVSVHADHSKRLEEDGVKYTLIHAGKHKVDGNQYSPLTGPAKARMQARVDSLYDEFAATVARNRGLDESDVRNTEAATFGAADSVRLGLVDAIGTPQEALTALFAELSGSKQPLGDKAMSTKTEQPGTQAAAPTITPEQEAAAAAAATADAPAAAAVDHAKIERERVGAILNCAEAAGRESLANHFAFNTGMSAEEAVAALKAAPAAPVKAPAAGAFSNAMASGNPDIPADGGEGGEPDAAQTILKDYAAGTGFKLPNRS